MGTQRPSKPRTEETDVFAEDWWSHARPILEFHGYLRVRAELFYRFSLGRLDPPQEMTWPRPADAPYTYNPPTFKQELCTEEEAGSGSNSSTDDLVRCSSNTQAGANMRFRLNPEIHVSDNLRIVSQIDILDNLVLGSTSSAYSVTPAVSGGYAVAQRAGYGALGFSDGTTSPPRSAINSLSDSIHVKRAWGEYSTPVGELRFGRMPNHWGLGMVYHSGDGYDDDYQSTMDRIQFVSGIKPLDLYLSASWDFPNEGPTSDNISVQRTPAYDIGQLDDVDQYMFTVARRKSPEMQRLALARGDVVVNGGLQVTYRSQLLSAIDSTTDTDVPLGCDSEGGTTALGCQPGDFENSYTRRDAHYWLPDLWVQILYKKFRFELEAATIQGSVGNASTDPENTEGTGKYNFRQWGFAGEIEQLLAEDRLRLGLGFGWASGDQDVDGLTESPALNNNPFGQIGGDRDVETFRFNPSYRVDLILFRNILQRVQGAYYFRPNLGYDFVREPAGQRLGGEVAAIWSRASEFIQAPGHDRDLGIEFNAALYFQSKDGALNDDPGEMGGFYSRLEYGILFPMAGLGYPAREAD
ncbi:MAG TPA: TIGR04551 family protein, partial [Polyangiaceae bacterium]